MRPRTLRETLLDHLDESEALVSRVVDVGLTMLRPRLEEIVADAAPAGVDPLAVRLSTGALDLDFRAAFLAAHAEASVTAARQATERRQAHGARGPVVKRSEIAERRKARTVRLVIVGGPKTGKTTLAESLPLPALHTDDLIGQRDWSSASAEVATWFDRPGPWVVEGVAAVRALRKWLALHPDGVPCDEVRVLDAPKAERTAEQDAMATACATVWAEVEPLLAERSVAITGE